MFAYSIFTKRHAVMLLLSKPRGRATFTGCMDITFLHTSS